MFNKKIVITTRSTTTPIASEAVGDGVVASFCTETATVMVGDVVGRRVGDV